MAESHPLNFGKANYPFRPGTTAPLGTVSAIPCLSMDIQQSLRLYPALAVDRLSLLTLKTPKSFDTNSNGSFTTKGRKSLLLDTLTEGL